MSSTKQLLQAGRKLISQPENWTQRATARADDGEKEDARAPQAVCWCSFGALIKVSDHDSQAMERAEHFLNEATSSGSYISFNDNATHEEVLAMWDKAIESCPPTSK